MPDGPSGLRRRALFGFAELLLILGLSLFLPAWSLDFWQAWLFLCVFSVCVLAITLYFLRRDPALIERRLKAGAAAEREKSQKVIQTLASIVFMMIFVTAGLDRHFRWSDVPAALVITGDFFIAVAFAIIFLVFKENSFTSATIEVGNDQRVISTGPYRIIRHPMYAGALLMLLFTPLALGSAWALASFPPMLAVIVWRLVDEEKFLAQRLPGYNAYRRQTRYRLAPWVW